MKERFKLLLSGPWVSAPGASTPWISKPLTRRSLEQRKTLTMQQILKCMAITALVLYVLLLVWGLMLKCNNVTSLRNTYRRYLKLDIAGRLKKNLIPFIQYFRPTFFYPKRAASIRDVPLNIMALIPFGFLMGFFLKKNRFAKVALIGFTLSLTVETFQLVTRLGAFCSDDLITNTTGAILGLLLFKLLYREKHARVWTYILFLGIAILVPILVYGAMKTYVNLDFYLDVIFRRL